MGDVTGRVVVVGAANVDVEASILGATVTADSNIGVVRRGAGGVGRNVAENLGRLGVATTLVTVLDDGPDGRWLAEHTARAGVDLTHAAHQPGTPSTYVSVVDATGELLVAVNDMRSVRAVDAEFLERRRTVIDGADVVVVDANLEPAAIAHLAEAHPDAVVLAEPVSASKARRLVPHLGWIGVVKPNRDELAVLADRPVSGPADVDAGIDVLLRAGVGQVVVSLGADGLVVATPDARSHLPAPTTEVVSVTGAGDAMTAGLVLGLASGWPPGRAARAGQAMAAITAGVAPSVDPTLTYERLAQELQTWT